MKTIHEQNISVVFTIILYDNKVAGKKYNFLRNGSANFPEVISG